MDTATQAYGREFRMPLGYRLSLRCPADTVDIKAEWLPYEPQPRGHSTRTALQRAHAAAWSQFAREVLLGNACARAGRSPGVIDAERKRLTPKMHSILRGAAIAGHTLIADTPTLKSASILERRGFLKLDPAPGGMHRATLTEIGRAAL